MTDNRIVVTEIDLDAIGDSWEALTDAGRTVTEAHDRNRWTLGDLGLRVETKYGEGSIGGYASAINVRPTTMYGYIATSRTFTLEDRAAFPPLSWSHYNIAARAGSRDLALVWLAKAADNGWSVDDLRTAINEAKGTAKISPPKLLEMDAVCIEIMRQFDQATAELIGYSIRFEVSVEAGEELASLLAPKQPCTLKVYGSLTPTGEADALAQADAEAMEGDGDAAV